MYSYKILYICLEDDQKPSTGHGAQDVFGTEMPAFSNDVRK